MDRLSRDFYQSRTLSEPCASEWSMIFSLSPYLYACEDGCIHGCMCPEVCRNPAVCMLSVSISLYYVGCKWWAWGLHEALGLLAQASCKYSSKQSARTRSRLHAHCRSITADLSGEPKNLGLLRYVGGEKRTMMSWRVFALLFLHED